MGLAFEAVPIVTARRFCAERALSWEAEARSRALNGELPFSGNAIEWESWRRPLADLLLHTGLLRPGTLGVAQGLGSWSGRLVLRRMLNSAAVRTRATR